MPQIQYQVLAEPILPPSGGGSVPSVSGWLPSAPDVILRAKTYPVSLFDGLSFVALTPSGPAVSDPGMFMAQSLMIYPVLMQYQAFAEPVLPIPTPSVPFLWQALTSDFMPRAKPFRVADAAQSVEPILPIHFVFANWMQYTQDFLPTRLRPPTAETQYISPFYPIPPNPTPPVRCSEGDILRFGTSAVYDGPSGHVIKMQPI